MPTVTIALLGPREKAFDEAAIFDEADRAKLWDDREKVELEVADYERLDSILQRAAEALNISIPWAPDSKFALTPYFVAFYDEETEGGHVPIDVVLTLVDEEGRAQWNVPFASVTFADLIRAREAGVLPGDPYRIYYPVYPGIGDGVLITWLAIVGAIKVVWKVMETIATIEDNLGFAQRVIETAKSRLGKGQPIIEAQYSSWEKRGGQPDSVLRMLGARPWHSADLADVLVCSEAEAEAILWAFGFAQDSAGLWRRRGDDAATLIDDAIDEINLSFSLGAGDYEEILEERVKRQLTTGKRAPRPHIDLERFGDTRAVPEDAQEEVPLDEDPNEFDDDDEALPLEQLQMRCACGEEGCSVAAQFSLVDGRLRIDFTEQTQHFVIDASFMTRVGIQVLDEIEAAELAARLSGIS
jgi:hypothetical protein